MRELSNILIVVAACIIAAAIFFRVTEGGAGTALTLATVASILYLGFNIGRVDVKRN